MSTPLPQFALRHGVTREIIPWFPTVDHDKCIGCQRIDETRIRPATMNSNGTTHHEIIVGTDEPGHRLELLHENVKWYGMVFSAIAPRSALCGVLRRR